VDPWTAAASTENYAPGDANHAWWAALDHEAMYRATLRAVDAFGLRDRCELLRERSDQALPRFADGALDLLHQDGNHSEEVSSREVDAWAPKLRRGGLYVMDDTSWATTARAQARLLELGFSVVEEHDNWRVLRKP
jgi:predicted O-methyltransferase YrrM